MFDFSSFGGKLLSGFGDILSNFTDPLHIFFPSGSQIRNESRADETLRMQREALQHQIDFDTWSQGFAENQFNVQKDLAYDGPAIALKSAASMGINPIVASGASAGSVGVSSPSSSTGSPNATSPVSNQTGASSLLGVLGSLIGTKMQGNVQKDIVESELASNEKIASMQNATKNRELDIQEEANQNQNQYWQGLLQNASQNLEVSKGQLELEKQKRLDKLFQDLYERSLQNEGLRIQYKQLEQRKAELERAIKADNKQLVGKIVGGICIIAASILGGPAAGVTAASIAAHINSGRQIGFQVGN